MDITIPYGKETISITLPEPVVILRPNMPRIQDKNHLILNALKSPIGAQSFQSFAQQAKRLLIIVNDATRPTPTSTILEYLSPILQKHSDVKFLVATGVHRAPTQEEYEFIFGKTFTVFQNKISAHDARRDEDMVYLGKSSNGTEMYINKLVQDYKNVVVIGSVEPHYFAGYTGGRKSFLPGVASYKTIEMNHKLALHESACSLKLEGNPVHEDMVDAMNVLKNINVFSIQTVLTGDHQLYAVTAGDLLQSFDAAIEHANHIFCVPLKEKGNIVISAAPYPMDIDLYQSQKAIDNAKHALEKGGILILVSKCRMGVGEEAFIELLSKACTPQEVFSILDQEYKLGFHKAAKMAEIGIHNHLWAVTDLDNSIIKKTMMKPYNNLQQAVDDAIQTIQKKGEQPKIVVMPQGSLTIPHYTGG